MRSEAVETNRLVHVLKGEIVKEQGTARAKDKKCAELMSDVALLEANAIKSNKFIQQLEGDLVKVECKARDKDKECAELKATVAFLEAKLSESKASLKQAIKELKDSAGSKENTAGNVPVNVSPAPPAACAMPGCDKPVFVDLQTKIAHSYCGRTHAKAHLREKLKEPHGRCHLCKLPGQPTSLLNGRARC
jgi:hypothetical protein